MEQNNMKNHGEGNEIADRRYRTSATDFARSERFEPAKAEAAQAYDAQPEEMRAAEREASAHAQLMQDATAREVAERTSELRKLRDSLRLKMHLAKKDAQDIYAEMEQKWDEVEAASRRIKETTSTSTREIQKRTKAVLDEIQTQYRRLKRMI